MACSVVSGAGSATAAAETHMRMIAKAGISLIISDRSFISAMLCLARIFSIGSALGKHNLQDEELAGASGRDECTGNLDALIFTPMSAWVDN